MKKREKGARESETGKEREEKSRGWEKKGGGRVFQFHINQSLLNSHLYPPLAPPLGTKLHHVTRGGAIDHAGGGHFNLF